ncbi:hypothetical protein JCM1393_10990 [Clostridium carnis]
MNSFKFPRIGLRNIKTAISVFLCLLLFPKDPFYAAIASVICMQPTVENTLKAGVNRLIGTLLGGTVGVIMLFLFRYLEISFLLPLFAGLGISLVIYSCNVVNKPAASSIASIVLVAIMVAPATSNPLMYATRRTIETAFGVVIAILVNKYFNPPKNKKEEEIIDDKK